MVENAVTPAQRRNYYLLVLSVVSMQVTASTIYMVLPLFFEQYGITKTQNGLLISIGTLAGVFSGLVAGKFSDSYGRKWFLVGGTAVYSVVFYLFAFLGKEFNTFLVLRFFEGIGFYVMPVLVSAMCADTFPSRERGRMMSLFSMAGGLGQLVGPLMAPYLINGSDFNMYFIFSGSFVVLSLVAMVTLVRETLPLELRTRRRPGGEAAGRRRIPRLCEVPGLGVRRLPCGHPPLQDRVHNDGPLLQHLPEGGAEPGPVIDQLPVRLEGHLHHGLRSRRRVARGQVGA
jgi:MFS family permease